MFSYQKNFTQPTLPVDESSFGALVRGTLWAELIDGFRRTGDASLKRRLPAFIFQATFDETVSKSGRRGCWRKQAATRLTGLVVMDIDHVEEPRNIYKVWQQEHAELFGESILLVYITPSGRGLKVVFKARTEWGNLIDNQHRMACLLGVEVDESCKDASRMSFICKEEDILYLSRELFTYENREFAERYTQEYRQGRSGARKPVGATAPAPRVMQTAEPCYHGVPYSRIVEAWLGDGRVQPGDRHRTSLQLADQLRYITDNDAALIEQVLRRTPFVDEIVRERNENVAQTVASAQGYSFFKSIPRRMQAALQAVGICQTENPSGFRGSETPSLPPLPDRLPPLLELLCSRVEADFKPAVAMSVFAPLDTHLRDVRYRHITGEEVEPGTMCLLVAPFSSGKSYINAPIDAIMADIRAMDLPAREEDREWGRKCQLLGSDQPRPARSEAPIQWIQPNTTPAAFLNLLLRAGGRPLYLRMDEIELLNNLAGSGVAATELLRVAFDHTRWGAERVSPNAVNGEAPLRLNFNCSTTPGTARTYLSRAIANGTLSRLTLCTIQRDPFAPTPQVGSYDTAFTDALQPYIARLREARGMVECQECLEFIRRLDDETRDYLLTSEDNVVLYLFKRALVSALRRAMTLFIAQGRWSSGIEDFVRASYWYDLELKRQLFGEQMVACMEGEQVCVRPRGPQNLLLQLGQVFTREELMELRAQYHMTSNPKGILSAWKRRGFILPLEEQPGSYRNLYRRNDQPEVNR